MDDDAQVLELIKRHLSELFNITYVNSFKNAMKGLPHEHIDFFILDEHLEDGQGKDFCYHLRKSLEHTNTPIFMLTGNDDIKEDLSSKVDVYPNPTSSIFTIDADNLNIDRVEIYDALGQKISSSTISQSYKYEVDLTSVIQGVYFVKVFSQGEIITKKIQKID